jgi:hypothetical protein
MNIRGCRALLLFSLIASPAFPDVIYSNDTPSNLIGVSTNPSEPGRIEHEAGDDFFLTSSASITGGTFTGLIPSGTVSNVVVEIYRVFPADSGPFDNKVPTRTNSPSDVAFDSRDSSASTLTFTTAVLAGTFATLNSVVNAPTTAPFATTGDGPKTGQEVRFNVTFTTPFNLADGHYFFVPQVELSSGGTFLWLSADRPVSFPPGVTDLQAWTRDANLDPDWLRVGTDIVGGAPAPTFNLAFSLSGSNVPEPSSLSLILCGLVLVVWSSRRKLVD